MGEENLNVNEQTTAADTQDEVKAETASNEQQVEETKTETPKDDKGSAKEDVPEVKTYTEEEVRKMIQAQTDKRVTEALKTAKGKWQTEYEENLAKEKAEAERLAKLSAEERKQEELKKMQSEIDNERAEFERQRDEFKRERMMLDTVKKLSADGMPTTFAEFLVGKTEEATAENIKAFSDMWKTTLQTAIEQHVENRLRGQEPQSSNSQGSGGLMSKREFANIPAKERMRMMKEDPELVQAILAQK